MARGRPRKNAKRHPGGEVKRPGKRARAMGKAEDMTRIAAEARERVFGVPTAYSRIPDAGSVLGRLCLLGSRDGISAQQRDAGKLYEEIVRDWNAAILARRVMSGSDLERTGGHDSSDGTEPDYVAKYERAKGRYVRARRALLLSHDAMAQMVIDAVVLDDIPMDCHVGTLRVALNALAHEFSTELIRAA